VSRLATTATKSSRRSTAVGAAATRTAPRRHDEIMDAAARVFASKGFHGASTQDIADVLGIKQASLYHYFPSKEIALDTVCIIGAEGFYERAKAIVEGPGSSQEKLEKLAFSHLSPLSDRADYVRVFLNERRQLPSTSRRKVGRWSRGLERLFERVIADGMRDGSFDKAVDARLATLALLGALNAVSAWLAKEDRKVDDIASGIAALTLRGLMRR
jgi:TetR/AcrR family transcriptional regulator, cholesterol catabolism regulator